MGQEANRYCLIFEVFCLLLSAIFKCTSMSLDYISQNLHMYMVTHMVASLSEPLQDLKIAASAQHCHPVSFSAPNSRKCYVALDKPG